MLKLTFSKSSVPETINIQVASFRCYKIRSNRSNGILVSMVTPVFNLYLFKMRTVFLMSVNKLNFRVVFTTQV